MQGVPQARDKAFCTLCEKLNQQKPWDVGGYKSVTSENHRKRTGDSEDGGGKYQDFLSWFKEDKCWQPAWFELDAGPDIELDVGLSVGLDIGSHVE